MMKKVAFGKTGFQVSSLGFGAAPIGFLKTEREKVGRMLNFLLDSGLNLIDTAAMYEGAEAAIGEAVGHRRKDYVLVSKCGTKLTDVPGSPFSPPLIAATVDRALKNLCTDYLDVMLLHSCDSKTLQLGDALAELVKARDAGKIRFVGYSGDNEAAAYAAALPDVAVIETSVNLADQANIDSVLPIARKHDVGVIAKRPICNAAWKSIDQQQGLYKSYAKTYTARLAKMQLDPAALGFTGEDAWPELALRFTLSQPGVHVAIIGTTNPENAKANLAAAEKGLLPENVIRTIRDAFHRAAAGQNWTGQQ